MEEEKPVRKIDTARENENMIYVCTVKLYKKIGK